MFLEIKCLTGGRLFFQFAQVLTVMKIPQRKIRVGMSVKRYDVEKNTISI